MDSTTWQRAQELFGLAIEKPAVERRPFLEKACADDAELRALVEKLLDSHEKAGSFLSAPTVEPGSVDAGATAPSGPADGPATRIGPYKLLQRIGEGGFGLVYMAEQEQPVRRRVALKIIKLGMDTPQVVARFEAERQALALMDHPNIARVLDGGATESGRPYFVMDLVLGIPITDYCDRHSLSPRERLDLFIAVCQAVQHAHQKGIIHRDLKPSNVLVTVADDRPVPKVIDFGIAKALHQRLTDKTLFTGFHQLLGTPEYMSPEQADLHAVDIDTRSDIYSLGAPLYELLTGTTPFDHGTLRVATYEELRHLICEVEPPKPSTRVAADLRLGRPNVAAGLCAGRINDEIDTIVLKCLQKERERRYQTASELARDVGHYLSGEPIEAKRDSAGYVLRKHLRKYRLPVTVAAGFLVVTTAGLITSLALWRQASAERDRTGEALKLAERRQQETQQVADFQSSMLGETDVEGMGLAIVDGFEERIREVLAKGIEDQAELDRLMQEWRQRTLKAGPTNVALAVLDEYVLARAAKAIQKDFAEQPLVRAALQQTAAETYCEIGLYEPALPLQEAALQTRREQLGDDHASTLTSIGSMGNLLHEMGMHEEALPYHREALEGFRRVLGDDHPDTLTSINNMGMLLQSMGKLAESDLHLREALDGRRRVLGDDHPGTLESMNNMGFLLNSMGRWPDAEPYYGAALEGRRRVLGDDHPSTLLSINNLGALLGEMGRYGEAEPYYGAALEGRRRVLGDNHPHTLLSMNNMGFLLQSMGKLDEAERHFRAALEGNRRVLGDDHPQTLLSLNNMGFLLAGMGKLAEAERYHREALERRRRVLGNEHMDTLASLHNLTHTLFNLGRLEEAEERGAELVRIAKRSLPEGHAYTGIILTNYGKCLARLERYAEAGSALLEAHGILATALGPEHERTIRMIQSLVELYDAWHAAEPGQGHDAKAAEWRAKLEAWQASTRPVTTQPAATPTPPAGQGQP